MKKNCLILAILMSICLVLSACGSSPQENAPAPDQAPSAQPDSGGTPAEDPAPQDPENSEPKTLSIGTLLTSDTFDPTIVANNPTLMLVYDSILTRDPETNEIIGNLAETWEFSEDGTEVTLHFRDDVYFSNGEKLTPDDALYSLGRYRVNDQFFKDSGWENIDFDNSRVEGNDLILKLFQSTPLIEAQLADNKWGTVLCQSYVEANPDSFWDAPVGSGPFILTENASGSHYALERNESYWGTPADISSVYYYIYGDATTMFVDFENGDLDMAIDVASSDADRMIEGGIDAQYKMMETYDINYVALPWYTPEFDDIRIREAISLALDREGISKAAFGNLAETADSVGIKGLPYYESQGDPKYDIEAAKKLMADAGYPDGGLEFNLVVFSQPAKQKQAEAIQACLAEIGITVTIEAYDPPTAIPIFMAQGTAIALGGTSGSNYDLAKYLSDSSLESSNQTTSVHDEEYNEWLSTARFSLDPEVRADCYSKIQKWHAENYRWIPLNYIQSCTVYQNNVHNVYAFNYNNPDVYHITKD